MSQNYQINVQVDDEFIDQLNGSQLSDDGKEGGLTQNTLSIAAIATLKEHDLAQGTMTIVLAEDAEVQSLNLTYLGIDAPTDVLSFPSQDDSMQDPNMQAPNMPLELPPELAAEQAAYLGDLVIAFPYSKKQAEQNQRTLAEELSLLVVHGTLHLLGYDHVTVKEEQEMWSVQADILASLGMVVPVESRVE